MVKTQVLPKLADHNLVLCTVRTTVEESVAGKRKVWKYGDAKWDQMRNRIVLMDWSIAFEQDVEQKRTITH